MEIINVEIIETKVFELQLSGAPDVTSRMGRDYRPTLLKIYFDKTGEEPWMLAEVRASGPRYKKDGSLGKFTENDEWLGYNTRDFRDRAPEWIQYIAGRYLDELDGGLPALNPVDTANRLTVPELPQRKPIAQPDLEPLPEVADDVDEIMELLEPAGHPETEAEEIPEPQPEDRWVPVAIDGKVVLLDRSRGNYAVVDVYRNAEEGIWLRAYFRDTLADVQREIELSLNIMGDHLSNDEDVSQLVGFRVVTLND